MTPTTSDGTADHAHSGRADTAVVMKMDNSTTAASTDMADSKDAKRAVCAFASLPDEIIELILSTCDPSSFASLVLLNPNWRRVSQQAQLYALQLSRCRSYATSHRTVASPPDDDELPKLRRAFAHEVKRNLYEAYLRPQETIVKLVSTSISSSAALPGGEAFHFAFSSNGQYVLAYSTSRIHVLRFVGQEITVERELKILRRPASITILDDGSMLAVLSMDHQVDLYDLSNGRPKHIRAIALDHHPRTISLSPGGSVLAAAYDGGIEVYSLSTAVATDKRGVKSDAADSLSFSKDGMQLLGTTIHSKNPNTVILTAPYFNPGEYSPEDSIGQLWATSILFPNSSRDCSHAVLLPSASDCGANWTFTYDRAFETFRAVRIDDLRNGTTYFTGPVADSSSTSKLLPNTLPATTGSGDLVSAGFLGKEIWCYGVPEDLDAPPESAAEADSADLGTPHSHKSTLSGSGQRDSTTVPKDANGNKIPKWQELSNRSRSRNSFIEGRHVSSLDGIVALKWVATSQGTSCERLVAAAPGGVGYAQGHAFDLNEEGIAPMDGGRLLLLDFDYSIVNGEKRTITIEVGEKEPEILEEEHRDMETEVAIVRRRTVAQSRREHPAVLRSTTIAARPERGPVFTLPRRLEELPASALRRPSVSKAALSPTDETSETASMNSIDDQEALDAPYAHGTPRSVATLRRAATAAAINRVLHPRRFGEAPGPPRMRPADGHNEVPHESDADNWVPPPPPYSKDDIPTLPEHLRNAIQVGVSGLPSNLHRSSTQRSGASSESSPLTSLRRSRTTYVPMSRSSESPVSPPLPLASPVSPPFAAAIPRPTSVSSAISASSNLDREPQSFQTSTNAVDFDDMYDVSPQRTPEPSVAVPVAPAPVAPAPVNMIPRRPVAQSVVTVPESPVMSTPSVEPVSPIPRRTIPIPTVRDMSVTPDHLDGGASNASNGMPADAEKPLTLSEQTAPTGGTQVQYATTEVPQGSQLSSLPTMSPITPLTLHYPPSHDPPPPPDISPDANSGVPAPPAELTPADVNLPSTSLLERLNSRAQRPSSQQLGIQPGTLPGSFQQPPAIHPVYRNNTYPESPGQVGAVPVQYSQTSYTDFGPPPPRAAAGAYNAQMSPIYPPPSHGQTNLVGYPSPYGDQQPFSPDSLRPQMVRLETIYSVGSNGSGPAHTPTWPMATGVSRRASRAERSAAINIQQAKQKGWRGTVKRKKKKKKDLDAVSSAGWTDVTTASYESEPSRRDRKGKCEIM